MLPVLLLYGESNTCAEFTCITITPHQHRAREKKKLHTFLFRKQDWNVILQNIDTLQRPIRPPPPPSPQNMEVMLFLPYKTFCVSVRSTPGATLSESVIRSANAERVTGMFGPFQCLTHQISGARARRAQNVAHNSCMSLRCTGTRWFASSRTPHGTMRRTRATCGSPSTVDNVPFDYVDVTRDASAPHTGCTMYICMDGYIYVPVHASHARVSCGVCD